MKHASLILGSFLCCCTFSCGPQPTNPSADKGIFPQDGGSSEQASNPTFADGVDSEDEENNSSNPKSDKEYFPDTSSNQQPGSSTEGIR